MLDAYELSIIRAELAATIEGTCRVDRVTDSAGTQTWSTGSTVDCIVGSPGQGNATDQTYYTGGEPGLTIWLPASTSVRTGDRIYDVRNSNTYKVMHVPSIHTDELRRGCVCVEVRTPGADA